MRGIQAAPALSWVLVRPVHPVAQRGFAVPLCVSLESSLFWKMSEGGEAGLPGLSREPSVSKAEVGGL